MDFSNHKIDVLTGKIPGTYLFHNNPQQMLDKKNLSSQDYQHKYSPFYNPELRMTLDEIKQMDAQDLAIFKANESKRKANNSAKPNKIAC